MKRIIVLALLSLSGLVEAYKIEVKNETDKALKVLILYQPAGGEMLKTAITAMTKEPRIDKLDNNMDGAMWGFEGNFSKENDKYLQAKVLDPKGQGTDSHKFDVGAGCIRKVKAWVVTKKSLPADQITTAMVSGGDKGGTNLGRIYDKNKSQWNMWVTNKTPVEYIEYTNAYSKSWDTKKASGNTCASHTYKVFVSGDKLTVEQTK